MIAPAVAAEVFVDPQLGGRRAPPGERGDDQRYMPWRGHHRVGAVGFALERHAWMGVHIGDDIQPGLTAHLP